MQMRVKYNLYRSVIIFSIGVLLIGCMAPKEAALQTQVPVKDNYCKLKKFSASYNSGKVYINWLVSTNMSNYYFILEKSRDGENYFPVSVQKGFPSPTEAGLSYSYIDEKLISTSRVYRLKLVQPIKNGQEIVLYADENNLFKDLDNALIRVDNDNTSASK